MWMDSSRDDSAVPEVRVCVWESWRGETPWFDDDDDDALLQQTEWTGVFIQLQAGWDRRQENKHSAFEVKQTKIRTNTVNHILHLALIKHQNKNNL